MQKETAKSHGSGAQTAAEPERGLIVKNVTVTHGSRSILTGVSFSIRPGEACIIVGPNGSGKTTLLRCLLGLHPRRLGLVENRFLRFGYVPQIRTLDPLFPVSVRGALQMSFPGPAPMLLPARRAAVARAIEEALEYAGIRHLSGKLLRECSGGQLQKVLIARALVHRPELLVLDEPTNSLDQEGKQDLMNLLRRFRSEGAAILMTTHETEIAASAVFDAELRLEGQTAAKNNRGSERSRVS